MGDIKRQRKKYQTPKKPWDKKRIDMENELLKEYGLRRKREIWRSEAILRGIRKQAKELSAVEDPEKMEKLFERVKRLGLVGDNPTLDDLLELTVRDILERRLQTILFRKGLANTPKQARQFIVHKHVMVGEKKIRWPSFLVPKDLEDKIKVDLEK
ncbi:MAG: 30S ribosomal protein S4 [Candidatus Aenigmatarchaeota archaeon]|nr:MAG: 30S ribosomal protein S4 [Candidatus Aenigmarchaeota archaeon]